MMEALQIDNVTKHYGDKTAVNGISLTVAQGEIYGLIGGNGAGKTTTMRMVMGIINPDAGNILWKGRGYTNQLRRQMGYLPEERGLYPKIKVSDQIIYLAQLRGLTYKQANTSLKEWLERFGVPEYYNKKVEELSKGNQQKIQFIAAVIHDPEIIILDEAFSGLDPVNVEILKNAVKQLRDQGKAILFSSHQMDHVEELCQNISILHKSNTVLKGKLREIKKSYPQDRILLDTDTTVTGLERIPGVVSVAKTDSGYDIRFSEKKAPHDVLLTAIGQTTIQRFQIMQPTLNEIFIQKVGEDIE